MKCIVKQIDDLQGLAVDLLENINSYSVVALKGQMGVGKTTFIQFVLKAMGIEKLDGSPSYSLINQYESLFFGIVYHLDLYRLDNIEEIYDIGIEEIIYKKSICFIEWPELMLDILPADTLWIEITLEEDFSRLINIKYDNKS